MSLLSKVRRSEVGRPRPQLHVPLSVGEAVDRDRIFHSTHALDLPSWYRRAAARSSSTLSRDSVEDSDVYAGGQIGA